MSSPEDETAEPQWQIETFYFGNAVWPSHAAYRVRGELIQYRVEKDLPLTLREGTNQYDADVSEVAEFLAEHEDCHFTVADSYELRDGDRQAPYLWVNGWKELPDDQHHIYEQDKADAWQEPSELKPA